IKSIKLLHKELVSDFNLTNGAIEKSNDSDVIKRFKDSNNKDINLFNNI
ncbi:2129_t:CDS:1, partial [Gigaspora margarita]